MPRGKKELAEQIIPKLREVEVEVGSGQACHSARQNWPPAPRSWPGFRRLSLAGYARLPTTGSCVTGCSIGSCS